jgi:hypothetical protein
MGKFKWTFHNVVAHPLSEVLFLVGATDLSKRVHDGSVPKDTTEDLDNEKLQADLDEARRVANDVLKHMFSRTHPFSASVEWDHETTAIVRDLYKVAGIVQ